MYDITSAFWTADRAISRTSHRRTARMDVLLRNWRHQWRSMMTVRVSVDKKSLRSKRHSLGLSQSSFCCWRKISSINFFDIRRNQERAPASGDWDRERRYFIGFHIGREHFIKCRITHAENLGYRSYLSKHRIILSEERDLCVERTGEGDIIFTGNLALPIVIGSERTV
jgi:hypothetical protein